MYNTFQGKRVLITGGTGSFGSNFAKHLLKKTKLKKLIIFSRDEFKQYYLEKEINDKRVNCFLGDIRDAQRLQRAFNKVDIVVHAAALKQVPALEYNPLEAVKTNVNGSQNIIEAAIDQKVSKVLLVSTDKAAHPSNLYGATKLCAERLFVSGNSYSGNQTKFSAVRYGNVLGSRGSIVETLLKNPNTKKVQITDPEMTRFWITLEQSFELVLSALDNMIGGEIFVPDIPSMKLVDLFNTLTPNAEKEIIGIRPGEKLHEILLTEDEARRTVKFEKNLVILPEITFEPKVQKKYSKYYKRGEEIKTPFCFTSNTNKKWLTPKKLAKLIEKMKKS